MIPIIPFFDMPHDLTTIDEVSVEKIVTFTNVNVDIDKTLKISESAFNGIIPNNSMTYLFSSEINKSSISESDADDSYLTEDYDIIIKFPKVKTFKTTVRINSKKKFTPKLSI